MTQGSAGLAEVETLLGSAPAAQWLPRLKQAAQGGSHGTGPSGDRDAALVRVLDKAVALAPEDWELRCLRGKTRTGQSDFEGALDDFARAIALSPKASRPYADRAFLHSRLGRWDEALADLERAQSLGERGLEQERALALLSLGRAADAIVLLKKASAGSPDPELRYQLGRALVMDGKASEALAPLREARAQARPDSRRKRPYEAMEALAESLAHAGQAKEAAPGEAFMKQARKKAAADGKGCLWLFGVGIDRPYEITLNTVMALKRCDAVYAQDDTREVRELLQAVAPNLRSIAHSAKASPQDEVWKRLEPELAKGAQAGYVTYGHPMLYGEGSRLAKRCAAAGYRYRVVTAPSTIDGMLTMLQDDLDLAERGFSVSNARSLTEDGAAVDPSRAALIMGLNRVMEEGKYGAFCDALEELYGADHRVQALKCADGYREEARLTLTVAELRAKERELDPALSLYVPEKRERKGKRA